MWIKLYSATNESDHMKWTTLCAGPNAFITDKHNLYEIRVLQWHQL
jgi:hypothetical protein